MRNLIFVLFAFAALSLRAQDAREILGKSIQAVAGLEKASYHIEVRQTNFLNGDTIISSADCFLQRVAGDTVTGMYYYFAKDHSGFNKYNGKAYYSYDPEYYSFIFRYTVKDNPEKFRTIRLPNGYVPPEPTSLIYYSSSLFRSGEELSSFLDDIAPEKIRAGSLLKVNSDTVADGIRCYGLRLSKPKKNFTYRKIILLDRESLLPVTVIKDFRGGNLTLNKENLSIGQYTCIKYSGIKESIPRFDYLMSERSLPRKVEITDHLPFSEPFKFGDNAPAWKLPEAGSDRLISLDSLGGKILVLDFTSTWCFHCVEGSMTMKELYDKYRERKDVLFFNIFSSSSDSREKVLKYIANRNLEGISLYNASGIEKAYGILGYPDFFLIDRHGRIAYFQRGYSQDLEKILVAQIEDCLGKK